MSLGLLVTGTGSAAGASAGQATDEVVTGAKKVGHGVEHTAKGIGRTIQRFFTGH